MSSAKFIVNDLPPRKVPNPDSHLLSSLEEIVRSAPAENGPWMDATGSPNKDCFIGLYVGPTAFAYLFLHVSKSHPALIINGQSASYWAKAYLSVPRPEASSGYIAAIASNCGIISETFSFLAVSAAVTQDAVHVTKFLDLLETTNIYTSEGWNDWCYGRSGTLYLLRLMRTWLPTSSTIINTAIQKLSAHILTLGPPFIYRERRQYGAGHGELGVLTQLILSSPDPSEFITSTPKITQMLEDLLDLQLPNGTWVHSTENPKEFVQFCHGAPGFAISLVCILPYISPINPTLSTRIEAAIKAARAITWTKGHLSKTPNLCHGTLGNAFAFPALSVEREHFLSFCTKDEVEKGEREGTYESCDYGFPYSVGFGAVGGRGWGWLARERETAVYIAYNDI